MHVDLTAEEIEVLRSLLVGNGEEIRTLPKAIKQPIVLKFHVALEEARSDDSYPDTLTQKRKVPVLPFPTTL